MVSGFGHTSFATMHKENLFFFYYLYEQKISLGTAVFVVMILIMLS